MIQRARLLAVALAALIMGMPRPALACPVCFGASDAPMAVATNLGIIAMLVVVVGVLGAFVSFFIYLMRRAKMAAQMDVDGNHLVN
jgi:hypothetical protein